MSQLPPAEAIPRFKENEERIDIFVNDPDAIGSYTTNEDTPREVEALPALIQRLQTHYLGIQFKGDWATTTGYSVNDIVKQSGNLYLGIQNHTSGTFATDLAAGKWVIYQGISISETTSEAAAVIGPNYIFYRKPGDLRRYSAAGDGTTDDTTAIQNAVSQCTQNGDPVFVPRGYTFLTGNITVPSNLQIYGEGSTSRLKAKASLNNHVLSVSTTDVYIDEVRFNNFSIDGNKANNTSGNSIYLNGRNCEVVGMHIINSPMNAVLFGTPHSGGILTPLAGRGMISGCDFINCGKNNNFGPVAITHGTDIHVVHNRIWNIDGQGQYAIDVEPNAANIATGILVAQNIIRGGQILLDARNISGSAWIASHTYAVGQTVINDTGKIYHCDVGGTSAGSGGPTGTGTAITDSGVTWRYYGTLAIAFVIGTTVSKNIVDARGSYKSADNTNMAPIWVRQATDLEILGNNTYGHDTCTMGGLVIESSSISTTWSVDGAIVANNNFKSDYSASRNGYINKANDVVFNGNKWKATSSANGLEFNNCDDIIGIGNKVLNLGAGRALSIGAGQVDFDDSNKLVGTAASTNSGTGRVVLPDLYGSKAWDIGSTGTQVSISTQVTVTGCSRTKGMRVKAVIMSNLGQGWSITGSITNTDEVTVVATNVTGSTVDPASGTLTVCVGRELVV